MQTLKTAVVVVLLLIVLYGVYEVLSRPEPAPPEELAWLEQEGLGPPQINFDAAPGLSGGAAEASLPSLTGPPLAGTSPATPTPPSVPPTTDSAAVLGPPSFAAADSPMATDAATPPSAGPAREAPSPPSFYGTAASAGTTAAPPSSPAAAPPTATPPANALTSPPNDPRLQGNPFLNEEIKVRPSAAVEVAGTPAAPGQATGSVRPYDRALKLAKVAIQEGRLAEALGDLSMFYKSPDLSAQEQQELIDLLDPLAGKVVYATDYHLEPPYRVGREETLMQVAEKYQVPWQLLQKINGVENPRILLPGSELKVVRGPFRADVDLATKELTVFVDRLYAGRFPINIGSDMPLQPGEYDVRDKQEDRPYFAADGRTIPAGNPRNPYGNIWLDLGREVCIHGSPVAGDSGSLGCISLSPRDAGDVFSILSVGSRIRILR